MAGVVLLFGRLKDAFGASSIALPEGAGTAAELRSLLVALNPDLADVLRAKTVRIECDQHRPQLRRRPHALRHSNRRRPERVLQSPEQQNHARHQPPVVDMLRGLAGVASRA